jgi:hypothetical protein
MNMGLGDKFTNLPWNKPFFHPGDPYGKAQDVSNQSWKEAQNYQRPYWEQGVGQTGRLNDAENSLLNPQGLQDKWSSSYETSPYAKQLLQQNQTAGLDAASSMGLGGSSAAMNNIQTGAGNIVSKDRQQYMDDLMKKYMAGIGIGQNMYGIGAQAGANLGGQSLEHGRDQAQLEYNKQAAPGEMWKHLAGSALSGVSNYATGGAGGISHGYTG